MHVNPINIPTISSQLTAAARAHVHMAKAPDRQHIRLPTSLLRTLPPCLSERQTFGLSCVIPPPSSLPLCCYYSSSPGQGLGTSATQRTLDCSDPSRKVFFFQLHLPVCLFLCVSDSVRLHWAFVSSCWELVLWLSVSIRPDCCGHCWGTVAGRLTLLTAVFVASEC